MRCLVTGGAGFIGSHLVDELIEAGHDVAVIDNLSTGKKENINLKAGFHQLDICDFDKIKPLFEGVDFVFHLAAIPRVPLSIENPVLTSRVNILGTINVFKAAADNSCKRVVSASSSSVYGICDPVNIPTAEWAPIKTEYPYAESKYQGERWVSHYNKVYGLPTVSLRLFNVYGPRSRTTGAYGAVFGTFLAQKINGKPFTVVGDGRQSRDFIWVGDVCEAFIKAAESKVVGEVFNVGTGNPQTILRLAELLGGEVTHLLKRPGEPDITCADISKIRQMLNWQSRVSFEEGVKIMLDNIDDWKDAPVWTPETIGEATKNWFSLLGKTGGRDIG